MEDSEIDEDDEGDADDSDNDDDYNPRSDVSGGNNACGSKL